MTESDRQKLCDEISNFLKEKFESHSPAADKTAPVGITVGVFFLDGNRSILVELHPSIKDKESARGRMCRAVAKDLTDMADESAS